MRPGLLAVVFLACGWILAYPAGGLGYSYGPACQWVHLIGEVQVPEGREGVWPVQLTVTYQLPQMARPATLLTNYPLEGAPFRFFLAGFDEKIDGVIFVSPMFFFAKEIVFRYFARSADGSLSTPWRQSVFQPPLIPNLDIPKNKEKIFRCDSGIHLDPLILQ